MNQKQQGGDNSQNLQAGRDINLNYSSAAGANKRDFSIIDEIFRNVIKKIKTKDYSESNKEYLQVSKKIQLNFKGKEDQDRVREYFKHAYTVVSLIEERMREEDNEIQKMLGGHIFEKYNKLKDQDLENIHILESLFSQFIITGKEDDPYYTSCARAFVLFFFDDCTIFKKTDTEK